MKRRQTRYISLQKKNYYYNLNRHWARVGGNANV
jgi:hypothetical protein